MTKVAGVDPTDVVSLSGAYEEAYRQVPLLMRFFRRVCVLEKAGVELPQTTLLLGHRNEL